ncbi:antitoxin Xre/MbcA/ParS toxin-binding domain-containing protein [Rugamonas sp. CCM 8940]|uniref:antitoxin Xre/MbcA/ParS toxin-binding domain-containing protein n=1 Tax=Rugamonas sp. CCM 8940 TaxID=2765359 RepID=UPI0018F45A26|nr:antitoxin Xre/MbcA/ParS toxin-binding domain-containing protein [Rugamonas sp. CCM 8940]MBJ7314382.1 DUF2384 domain-containing protein [Rugamonas sp. CCM 8940]
MSAIDVLRDEYPGDDAWQRFVEVFRPAWGLWQEKDLYTSRLGDEEVAIVLTASLGVHAVDWFNNPCGALDTHVPIDVLRSSPSGMQIIRSLLMRMPR